MIYLTGLDNKKFVLNADHIEKMKSVPETVITLTNGKKYLVKENVQDIINGVLKYKREIYTLHNEYNTGGN